MDPLLGVLVDEAPRHFFVSYVSMTSHLSMCQLQSIAAAASTDSKGRTALSTRTAWDDIKKWESIITRHASGTGGGEPFWDLSNDAQVAYLKVMGANAACQQTQPPSPAQPPQPSHTGCGARSTR